MTQAGNEAEVAARLKSAAADLIGIYGGDGTVTRIVSALGTPPAPIVIFPGGTANSLADELGTGPIRDQLPFPGFNFHVGSYGAPFGFPEIFSIEVA